MDGSDDPVITPILLTVAAGVGGAALAKNQGQVQAPAAVQATKQVQGGLGEDEATQAEAERRRKKLAATILAKNWDEPVLGKPALLGLG